MTTSSVGSEVLVPQHADETRTRTAGVTEADGCDLRMRWAAAPAEDGDT